MSPSPSITRWRHRIVLPTVPYSGPPIAYDGDDGPDFEVSVARR